MTWREETEERRVHISCFLASEARCRTSLKCKLTPNLFPLFLWGITAFCHDSFAPLPVTPLITHPLVSPTALSLFFCFLFSVFALVAFRQPRLACTQSRLFHCFNTKLWCLKETSDFILLQTIITTTILCTSTYTYALHCCVIFIFGYLWGDHDCTANYFYAK